MTLEQANKVKDNYKHLIGTKDSKGFYTTDIWILPSNEERRDNVIRYYIQTDQQTLNFLGMENEDLVVWAVDTHSLKTTGLLIYKSLQNELVVQ